MPLPQAEALILLDARFDRQLIYNAGKFVQKAGEEKKLAQLNV